MLPLLHESLVQCLIELGILRKFNLRSLQSLRFHDVHRSIDLFLIATPVSDCGF